MCIRDRVCKGETPYRALVGRSPNVLHEFEDPTCSQLTDQDGVVGASRHAARLRELSVITILEKTAQERLERANRTKTRPSGELLELQIGDQVDGYRKPTTKDLTGWRGPMTVTGLEDCRRSGDHRDLARQASFYPASLA